MSESTMGQVKTDDSISRQAALEMLNDNELERQTDDVFDGDLHRYKRAAQRIIAQLPTVDAVPVVRCKECMHWDKTWTNDWSPDYHYCPMIDGVRKGDFYCAYAERNEE